MSYYYTNANQINKHKFLKWYNVKPTAKQARIVQQKDTHKTTQSINSNKMFKYNSFNLVLLYQYMIMADSNKPSAKNCALAIKITNLVSGATLIGFGLFGIVFMAINQLLSGRFFAIFSPLFMAIFGAVLIVTQFKMQQFYGPFGFLSTMIGRGIFNIYLSSEVFFYFACGQENTLIAWIAALVLFGLGSVYVCLHFLGGSGYAQQVKQQMM